jgi:hypothetical protein
VTSSWGVSVYQNAHPDTIIHPVWFILMKVGRKRSTRQNHTQQTANSKPKHKQVPRGIGVDNRKMGNDTQPRPNASATATTQRTQSQTQKRRANFPFSTYSSVPTPFFLG